MTRRPFRAPHHLASQVALIGGGQSPQSGRGVVGAQRDAVSRRTARIRAQRARSAAAAVGGEAGGGRRGPNTRVEYPANFTLVAAMNPCPCGYYNHPTRECTCSPGSVHRYMGRISGPLMDRIDLHVEVTPVAPQELSATAPGRAERGDPRTGRPGAGGAGGAVPQYGGRAYELDDEQRVRCANTAASMRLRRPCWSGRWSGCRFRRGLTTAF